MKIKTLRSILQTGAVLGVILLLSLAVILIVQFVELKNAEKRLQELNSGSINIEVAIQEDETIL